LLNRVGSVADMMAEERRGERGIVIASWSFTLIP